MDIKSKLAEVYEQLYPYQKEGINFLVKQNKGLNWDDMGLGKTVSTLYAVIYKMRQMFEQEIYNSPILIVCPSKALYVWQNEICKWFQLPSLLYLGTKKKRETLQKVIKQYPFVITTYGMIDELSPLCSWGYVIADEIHEAGILNHKTKTYESFCKLSSRSLGFYLLTGTPIRQGVIDTYAPLHLVDPLVFKNYWQFVNTHCIINETPFGKNIERNPRNIDAFRQMLSAYSIRRLKSEVLKDLPGKQRQPIPLQMTPMQDKVYQSVVNELLYADADNLIVAPNVMSSILRARQLLVTPRLLGIDEDGAALNYVKEEGYNLLKSDRSLVIYTPFRAAIPIIADVIKEMGLATKVYTIMGGLNPNEFANQWMGFQENPSNNKVLICVIKSGASFHATTSSTCFFLGYEWDFNYNTQAEDRLCRIGQKNCVNCYYLLHEGTVDENVKEKLNSKQDASNWIVGTELQYQMMIKRFRRVNQQMELDLKNN